MTTPSSVDPAQRLLDSLRTIEPIGGTHNVSFSDALGDLREGAIHAVERAVRSWGLDNMPLTDVTALPHLCIQAARWSAAYFADTACSEPPPCPHNPTSPEGRGWFRDVHWRPFLCKLETLFVSVDLEELEGRARDVLRSLSRRRVALFDARLENPLLRLLGESDAPKRPAHRHAYASGERAQIRPKAPASTSAGPV